MMVGCFQDASGQTGQMGLGTDKPHVLGVVPKKAEEGGGHVEALV